MGRKKRNTPTKPPTTPTPPATPEHANITDRQFDLLVAVAVLIVGIGVTHSSPVFGTVFIVIGCAILIWLALSVFGGPERVSRHQRLIGLLAVLCLIATGTYVFWPATDTSVPVVLPSPSPSLSPSPPPSASPAASPSPTSPASRTPPPRSPKPRPTSPPTPSAVATTAAEAELSDRASRLGMALMLAVQTQRATGDAASEKALPEYFRKIYDEHLRPEISRVLIDIQRERPQDKHDAREIVPKAVSPQHLQDVETVGRYLQTVARKISGPRSAQAMPPPEPTPGPRESLANRAGDLGLMIDRFRMTYSLRQLDQTHSEEILLQQLFQDYGRIQQDVLEVLVEIRKARPHDGLVFDIQRKAVTPITEYDLEAVSDYLLRTAKRLYD